MNDPTRADIYVVALQLDAQMAALEADLMGLPVSHPHRATYAALRADIATLMRAYPELNHSPKGNHMHIYDTLCAFAVRYQYNLTREDFATARREHGFPMPVVITGGEVWNRVDVEHWAALMEHSVPDWYDAAQLRGLEEKSTIERAKPDARMM